ncbi:cupin domain-containing protein [Arthrobacter sp.]|uniref:cupin domain-containing protein n=1 Tax=Arthrobacter sp. TaxID=1667 RepID=UPI0028972E03|nr:cupin domain-containing protein [Arthrobacter sp.]
MTNTSSIPVAPAPEATGLPAGVVIHPDSLDLVHEPVPESAVASGTPSTGLHELGNFGGVDLGVWEMSEGGMYDTEAEEVFVVLSGAATVEFLAADGSVAATHELTPHTLMRLAAGTRTRWTVTSTLRKVYLTAS